MNRFLGLFLLTYLFGFHISAATERTEEAIGSLKALIHPATLSLIQALDKIKLVPHEMIDGPEIQELLSKQSAAEYIKTHLLDSNGGEHYRRKVYAECKGPKSKQKCLITIMENYFNHETQENTGENAIVFEFELSAGKIKNPTVKVNLSG